MPRTAASCPAPSPTIWSSPRRRLPKLDLVHPTVNPSPFTRLGAKGIGEGNQYTTPVCLANAVADALGREDVQRPLTPPKVFEWIHGDEAPPPRTSRFAGKPRKDRHALDRRRRAIVPASPREIWDFLLDPGKLASVIPGCHELKQAATTPIAPTSTWGRGRSRAASPPMCACRT